MHQCRLEVWMVWMMEVLLRLALLSTKRVVLCGSVSIVRFSTRMDRRHARCVAYRGHSYLPLYPMVDKFPPSKPIWSGQHASSQWVMFSLIWLCSRSVPHTSCTIPSWTGDAYGIPALTLCGVQMVCLALQPSIFFILTIYSPPSPPPPLVLAFFLPPILTISCL